MSAVQLHVQTEYSLLQSTCRIQSLVEKAGQEGVTAVGIADTGVLYGVIPFYEACLAAGIKPLIGMEIIVQDADNKGGLYLIARTNEGYENLIRLSSTVQHQRDPVIEIERLADYKNGLTALSGGAGGIIEQSLAAGDPTRSEEILKSLASVFEAFFMEVPADAAGSPRRQQVITLAKEAAVPVIAGGNVNYLTPEEAPAVVCLAAIKDGESIEPDEGIKGHNYFKTSDELAAAFADIPEALENAAGLAATCDVSIDTGGQVELPAFPVPEGETAESYLEKLCRERLSGKYADNLEEAEERLTHELSVIKETGYSDYFLIVWDLLAYARNNGIYPGPGRGSAAGSLVAFLLDITEVDPLKYHLLFERFLNLERVSMPDIDIDFPDTKRDRMFHYMRRKYGQEHVAQIVTFGTLAAKAAVRDLGRVLAVEQALVDRLARLIPSKPGTTLRDAWEQSDEFKNLVKDDASLKYLFKIARVIEGLPRHSSIHAAGIIVSRRSLTGYIPLQDGNEGLYLTQYPMEVLEKLGLLKMDFLGLRNLTLIEEIESEIRRRGARYKRPVEMDDPDTYRLLSRGDTTGIFQLESQGMRSVLKRLKPVEFEDIVAVNALYRPGPMAFIETFIDRRHGHEAVKSIHPDLDEILSETRGVLVYQEQIMQIANRLAGFSMGEADLLRRAVSKKKSVVLEEQKKHFIEGCINKGYSAAAAENIYQWIESFANYGFNRSHAVAYSMIAYRLAYLKAHYPKAFMTALLGSVMHHQDKLETYVREMKVYHGIDLLPPSVNKSHINFTSEEDGIRFALSAIRNVGRGAADHIISVREENGPFKSFPDFCRRVSPQKVNRRTIEALILSGTMDVFDAGRASLLSSLDRYFSERDKRHFTDGQGHFDLEEEPARDLIEEVPPLTDQEKLTFEKEYIGFYLSAHPLDSYKKTLAGYNSMPITALQEGSTDRIAALLSGLKPIRTKKGKHMAFCELSDQSGSIEAVLFPAAYARYRRLIDENDRLFLEGKTEIARDRKQFIIEKMIALSSLQPVAEEKSQQEALYLKIPADFPSKRLKELKRVLQSHQGKVPVYLYYAATKKLLKLGSQYSIQMNEELKSRLGELLGPEQVKIAGMKTFD